MKNTLSTDTSPNSSHETPRWEFGATAWLLFAGLILLNLGFFLQLLVHAAGVTFVSLFNLFDFRTWPLWYFLCLAVVLGCSVRCFLLYKKHINDDLDPLYVDEAQCFWWLSGAIAVLLAVIVFLHRFSFLRQLYHPLYLWFGYGDFSYSALLIFTVFFATIGIVCFLAWKWILTILDTI
jgi:hypothetical protein